MPVRNEAAYLTDAVHAVLAQDYPGPLEVCVAVGPSNDDTAEIAAACAAADPRVRVVANPAGVTPAALNAAIAATTGEILVRVDGHCRLGPGYITTAVDIMQADAARRIGNVGGIQDAVGDTPFGMAVARAMTSRFGTGGGRLHLGGAAGPVDTVYLGVFRREALAAVGGFAEDLIRNQDYELNIRLRAADWVVWFDPRLTVRYTPRRTWAGLARQYHEYGQWKWVVARRHRGSLRPRQVIPAAVTAVLAVSLIDTVLAATLLSGWRRLLGLSAAVAYLAVVIIAAITSGRTLAERARLALIYPTMHLAWGAGFWRAAGRAILRSRREGRSL